MELNHEDLIITTFNTGTGFFMRVDTGVKIVHVPTGVFVCATEGRSQHANKDIALKLLKHHLERFYSTNPELKPMSTKPTIELTQKELRNRITTVLGSALNSREVVMWDSWPGSVFLAEHIVRDLGNIVEFGKGKIERGSKVVIKAGFSVGSRGKVEFVEPKGQAEGKIWVTRDGDSGPKYWYEHELEILE